MAVSFEEVRRMLDELKLKYQPRVEKDSFILLFKMDNYRNLKGENLLGLVLKLEEDGEYFKLFAPMAFKARGPYLDLFLKTAMVIQWRTKLIQFEYDDLDGEIRPIIEFPIEDSTLTTKQLARCIQGMVHLVDHYYPTLSKVLREGKVDWPPEDELLDLLRMLIGEDALDDDEDDNPEVL